MKKWTDNVSDWCMRANTSSVRHAMITLAESEAQEGNEKLGVDIWQAIIEDAKDSEDWALVSHMLTHGNKILGVQPDKIEGERYFEKEMQRHRDAIRGSK